ncbi:hypothetical protein [Fulvivirga sediminis]|uniref:Uncharacterized protein n=1 Tax=Fulvivirga sediminis TaxID=2803949 RepID=A0A937K0E7_9BACT|nr:hypothetical protein [Fulvivirga sediminis]MBL3656230.1 hypothetical protein [Fulvivirga sediminis]
MISIDNYPRLEFFVHSAQGDLIEESFKHVEKLPICWVACEELEIEYGKIFEEIGLEVEMNGGQLFYTDMHTKEVIAKISFSQDLVDMRITA